MTCTTIKKRRIKLNISVQHLAENAGVTPQAVGKWERGEGLPRADQLPKLAELLHCTIDELFDRENTS